MQENLNAGALNPAEAQLLLQRLSAAESRLSQYRQEIWRTQLSPVAVRKGFYGHGEEPVLVQLETIPMMKPFVTQYRELGRYVEGIWSVRTNPSLLNHPDWAHFARSVIQYSAALS